MDRSPRFAFPFLVPGQAQKELLHNEAIQAIEMLLCPVVEAAGLVAPPTGAAIGACYVVGNGAAGDWAGHDNSLTCFTEGGWRFVEAVEAMQVVDRSSGQTLAFRTGSWESGIVRAQQLVLNGETVVRQRQPGIADPVGGTVVDAECRAAISGLLAAIRAHGLIG